MKTIIEQFNINGAMSARDFASKVQEELTNPRSLSNGSAQKLAVGHTVYAAAQIKA